MRKKSIIKISSRDSSKEWDLDDVMPTEKDRWSDGKGWVSVSPSSDQVIRMDSPAIKKRMDERRKKLNKEIEDKAKLDPPKKEDEKPKEKPKPKKKPKAKKKKKSKRDKTLYVF